MWMSNVKVQIPILSSTLFSACGKVNAKEPIDQNFTLNRETKLAGSIFADSGEAALRWWRVFWRNTRALPPKNGDFNRRNRNRQQVAAGQNRGRNCGHRNQSQRIDAVGKFFYGALIIFFAGFLDMLDGQVARRQNRVTAFGAFYDSTLDRYADMALYMGLLVYYSVSGRTPYVVLAAVATAGSVMVSYARARAESLIPLCKVGFMERPERLVLLIIGGVFNRMAPVLWVIAVVSTLTVIHRIVFTWQETRAGRTLPGIKLSL
jgi:phosphatidylglycerophosphate synthase